ncbi:MAG: glycosyltransferase family 8 protein [Oscillospiraceae bacterium]|nr:glycosyltransferase family 8 protein [Oscillospiraceae bacterium]
MKILVTVNEKYIYPLKVMLYSLFSTQEEPVTVFLMHTEISASSVGMLRDFCHLYKAELLEVQIEEDAFENAPVMEHFSKEMYYRLLAPWLLPNEDRVLYLDPDIMINGSLRSLWEIDFDGALMVVVKDRPIELLGCRIKQELKKDSVYFNSGMLLMDLKRIREEIEQEEISALVTKWKDELEFPDQDILNLLYEGRTKQVGDTYNLMANLLYLVEYLKTLSIKKTRSLAKVVHYAGPNKPWNSGYKGTMYPLWAMAEWHAHPSSHLRIAGRLLLEPYRFVWVLWKFVKDYDWKQRFRKSKRQG